MKSPFVRELKPDEISTAIFLVQSKEVRQKRTGEPYLSLLLSDRSGEIDCKMWDNVAEIVHTFESDDFVKVKGIMQLYNNRPQFTIHKLRRVEEHEIDFRDFFPASLQDPDAMWCELRGIVSNLDNEHIRGFLNAFLDDPEIASRYRVAPAAKSIHHAFRGGLLEHVVSLLKLAKLVGGHYASIDLNLLVAGVVLHDIGKIHELSYERGFSYSPEGQLIGHIAIAIRMIAEKLRAFPQFPVELRNLIEHMVLSHHGQLEFGSPKLPIFPEALLLHYLDDMDSKMECMRVLMDKDPQAEGYFTSYSSTLSRAALRKTRYLESNGIGCTPGSNPTADEFGAARDEKTSAEAEGAVGREETSAQADAPAMRDPNGTGDTTTQYTTPTFPGRSQSPAPNPKPTPATNSIFGAKLQQALHNERK
jgi:3'-5' exoribonuclease